MAGKLVWHVMMSLDGFIAGADDEMDWVFEVDATPSAMAEEVVETMGAIVAGRRWYDIVTARYGSSEGIYGRKGVYGGRWRGPIVVLTHRPSDVRDVAGVTLVSDGIEDAVATARAAAAGKDIVVFRANVVERVPEGEGHELGSVADVAPQHPCAAVARRGLVTGNAGVADVLGVGVAILATDSAPPYTGNHRPIVCES